MSLIPDPRCPEGSGNQAVFFKWVWWKLACHLKFNDSPSVRWERSTRGITAHVRRAVPGGTAPAEEPGKAEELFLVKVWHDVLECKNSSEQTVWVLKSRKLRNSILIETLDGIAHSYVYDASYVSRTATAIINGVPKSELQVIVPRFIGAPSTTRWKNVDGTTTDLPDIIYGEKLTTPSDAIKTPGDSPLIVSAEYIDLNRDGRAWSSSNVQYQ